MDEKESEQEINKAFEEFKDMSKGAITKESLMKIAEDIEENISEEEIEDMIKEATKGSKTNMVNEN